LARRAPTSQITAGGREDPDDIGASADLLVSRSWRAVRHHYVERFISGVTNPF